MTKNQGAAGQLCLMCATCALRGTSKTLEDWYSPELFFLFANTPTMPLTEGFGLHHDEEGTFGVLVR